MRFIPCKIFIISLPHWQSLTNRPAVGTALYQFGHPFNNYLYRLNITDLLINVMKTFKKRLYYNGGITSITFLTYVVCHSWKVGFVVVLFFFSLPCHDGIHHILLTFLDMTNVVRQKWPVQNLNEAVKLEAEIL